MTGETDRGNGADRQFQERKSQNAQGGLAERVLARNEMTRAKSEVLGVISHKFSGYSVTALTRPLRMYGAQRAVWCSLCASVQC